MNETTQTEIDIAAAPVVGIYPGAESNLDGLNEASGASARAVSGRVYRSPRISRWPLAGFILWAALPTLLVAPTVWFSHVVWPGPLDPVLEWARVIGLYGAPVILFPWSMLLLRSRNEKHWIIKAIPLTVSMLVVSATIVFGPMRMGGAGGGIRGLGGSSGAAGQTQDA